LSFKHALAASACVEKTLNTISAPFDSFVVTTANRFAL
jgi:hypothetical protein